MELADLRVERSLPAFEADSDRSVEPAGLGGQIRQLLVREQKALAALRDAPEPEPAPLVASVDYHSPLKRRALIGVPFNDPEQLFPQRLDDEWGLHCVALRQRLPDQGRVLQGTAANLRISRANFGLLVRTPQSVECLL